MIFDNSLAFSLDNGGELFFGSFMYRDKAFMIL